MVFPWNSIYVWFWHWLIVRCRGISHVSSGKSMPSLLVKLNYDIKRLAFRGENWEFWWYLAMCNVHANFMLVKPKPKITFNHLMSTLCFFGGCYWALSIRYSREFEKSVRKLMSLVFFNVELFFLNVNFIILLTI